MVWRRILIILLACFAATVHAQQLPDLFPVKRGGLWGFIDRSGQVVIQPKYDLVEPFGSNRFAKAKKGEKVLVIDRLGASLDGLEFEDLEVIDDSTLAVSVNKKWGAATMDGTPLFEPRFQRVKGADSPDFFRVQYAGRWGMVNRAGKELVPAQFDSVGYNGVIFVPKKDSLYGIYTLAGVRISQPEYWDVTASGNIVFYRSRNMLWGAMGPSGEPFLDSDWEDFRPMLPYFIELKRENSSALYHIPGSSVIMDSTSSGYAFLWPNISAGYIRVRVNDELSIADSTGIVLFSGRYDEIIYTGGFFYVRSGSRWGLVDRNGAEIVKPQYTAINSFADNVAEVGKSGSWGVINTKGRLIIPAEYDEITIAALTANCRRGKRITLYELDESGNVVSMEDYTNVRTIKVTERDESLGKKGRTVTTGSNPDLDRPNRWFYSEYEKKWGLRDSLDSIVIKPRFSDVTFYPDLGVSRVEVTLQQPGTVIIGGGYLRFTRLYGLIDNETYRYVLPLSYLMMDMKQVADGNTGYIRLLSGNGKFAVGYTDGRVIPGYSYIGYPSGGYTRFLKEGNLHVKPVNSVRAIVSRDAYAQDIGARFSPAVTMRYSPSNTYYIHSDIGRWGYLDSAGREIIPATYDFAVDFDGDRAITVLNKKWGVINPQGDAMVKHAYSAISYAPGTQKRFYQLTLDSARSGFVHYQGKRIVQPKYMHLGDFHEGFASIKTGRFYNFTDLNGRTLNDKQYRAVRPFSEGLAAVRVGGFWYYIDTEGKEVIKTRYSRVGDFHHGLAWFYRNGKYGFINTKGKVAIPPRYAKAKDFNEYGLCVVKKKKKYGLINTEGKEVTLMRFGSIGPYSEGLAVARLFGAFVFLDTAGNIVETVRGYSRISSFKDGAALVIRHGHYGFINPEGKTLIKTNQPPCTDFENDVCIRGYKGKQGIMNKNGDLLVVNGLNVIGKFESGFALVKNQGGETYSFLDRNGKKRFGPYESAFPFEQGVARVQENGKWGLIDTNGLFIVMPVYDGMNSLSDEYIVTRQNGVYGLATRDGNILAKPEYSIIRFDSSRQVFQLEKENSLGYLRPDGSWMWTMQE